MQQLVGGEGAGLTSIVRRFQLACFTSAHTPTVGADVTSITLDKHLSDKLGAPTRMQFWDVAYREVRLHDRPIANTSPSPRHPPSQRGSMQSSTWTVQTPSSWSLTWGV